MHKELESVLYVWLNIGFVEFWKEPRCCLGWAEFGSVRKPVKVEKRLSARWCHTKQFRKPAGDVPCWSLLPLYKGWRWPQTLEGLGRFLLTQGPPARTVGLTFPAFEYGWLLPTSAVTAEGRIPSTFPHNVGQYLIRRSTQEIL